MITEPPAVTERMLDGARLASRIVRGELGGSPDRIPVLSEEYAVAAANFLGYVMFTVQLANGLHPRTSVDFTPGDDRGSELARGFLTAGTVEVCCDYCGQLMTRALAAAAAGQMRAVHGPDAAPLHWEALSQALTGTGP